MEKKICKRCNNEKLLNLFSKDPRNKDGHGALCLACSRLRANELYAKRPKTKRTTIENKIHNEYERKRYKTFNGWLYHMYRGCLTRKNKQCFITKEDIRKLWEKQKGLCAITKMPMDFTAEPRSYNRPSLDRIDNSRGYEVDNIRLVWTFVNLARNQYNDEQLYNYCLAVVEGMKGK